MPDCEVFHQFTFEAAHRLTGVPAGHPCARLHGHTWRVRFGVRGRIQPDRGWIVDFAELRQGADRVREQLDHRSLNEVDGLGNPTCENIALWLWERLMVDLPGLASLEVHEGDGGGCAIRL